MLQDGVPGLYRKPSLRPERAERRAREVGGFLRREKQRASFWFVPWLIIATTVIYMPGLLPPHNSRAPPGQQGESRPGWGGCTLCGTCESNCTRNVLSCAAAGLRRRPTYICFYLGPSSALWYAACHLSISMMLTLDLGPSLGA